MTFSKLAIALMDWFVTNKEEPQKREWCFLGFPKKDITRETVKEHFNRDDLNNSFKTNYKETDQTKVQAYSPLQAEIQQIQGLERSFVVRHKSRMQVYLDDRILKMFSTFETVADGNARLEAFKDRPKTTK